MNYDTENIKKEIKITYLVIYVNQYMIINQYLPKRSFIIDVRLCPLLIVNINLLNLLIIVAIGLKWLIDGR